MRDCIDVILEQISANDLTALVTAVYATSGTSIRAGDPIAVVETTKASFEVEAPADGVVIHSLKVGDSVVAGTTLAQIAPEGDSVSAAPNSPAEQRPARQATRFSRDAEALARAHGITAEEFSTTFVTAEDVRRRIEQSKFTAPTTAGTVDPLSPRKLEEIAILQGGAGSSLLSWVGVTVSVQRPTRPGAGFFEDRITDLVIYEASRLMHEFRRLNAAFRGNAIECYSRVTAGIAFDGGSGLVVYGIRNSDTLSLEAIQEEILNGLRQYATNALEPRNVARATFTVSDLSATGIEFMMPLLPAGQSCVIGITAFEGRGYRLSVGFDHRVTEGLEVSRFLQKLRGAVQRQLA